MPRLSLYRPEKGNDYKFIDKTIWEMFQVGGTDVLVHKYLGPATTPPWSATTAYKVDDQVSINNRVYKAIRANTNQQPPNTTYWEFVREGTPSQPVYTDNDIFNIQDLLFLENRDRKYDDDVFVMRCVYNIQDIDFNLSQFGFFLQNDTIFVTFHINDTVEKLGRKILAGDVIELPHLKDDFAFNDLSFALKRFYVIEEVSRAAEGFSVTWYPHLYRAKCKPLVNSQEFKDILDGIADSDNNKGVWTGDVTYYPNDVVTGPDGQSYTCIVPAGLDYSDTVTYYPGDVVNGPDGVQYVVIDNTKPVWDGNVTYNPGDQITGPDGKIYIVTETVTGVLPPDSEYYTPTQGTGVVGADPSTSDRFEPIYVVVDGVTNIFPPNSTYWEISQTLGEIVSTYEREMQITQAVLDQAEADAPRSGFDTSYFYTVQQDETGRAALVTVDTDQLLASTQTQAADAEGNLLYDESGAPVWNETDQDQAVSASTMLATAVAKGYTGYITQDGIPANGAPFTAGIAFPQSPVDGQYCLRKDYMPHRLFRFNGSRWVKVEDIKRMTMSNLGASDTGPGGTFEGKDIRQTQKASFINNTNKDCIDGREVEEKQSLSKALRPKADE